MTTTTYEEYRRRYEAAEYFVDHHLRNEVVEYFEELLGDKYYYNLFRQKESIVDRWRWMEKMVQSYPYVVLYAKELKLYETYSASVKAKALQSLLRKKGLSVRREVLYRFFQHGYNDKFYNVLNEVLSVIDSIGKKCEHWSLYDENYVGMSSHRVDEDLYPLDNEMLSWMIEWILGNMETDITKLRRILNIYILRTRKVVPKRKYIIIDEWCSTCTPESGRHKYVYQYELTLPVLARVVHLTPWSHYEYFDILTSCTPKSQYEFDLKSVEKVVENTF